LESIEKAVQSLGKKADVAIRSRLYSPKRAEIKLAKITSKLAKSESEIPELSVDMTEIAMQLHSFYDSRMERLKAEKLSRKMFQTLTNILKRAGSGKINLTGRNKSRVGALAGYWKDVAREDAQARESILKEKAQAYIDKGNYDEACKVFQTVLKAKKKINDQAGIAATFRDIAEVMKLKGNTKEALSYFRKAAAINPLAWFDVGFVLGEIQQYKKSITAYNKFLKIVPDDASAWNNKGWAYENLSNFPKALKCYERALTSNPQLVVSWMGKGLMLWRLGRPIQATDAFEEVLKIDPDNQNVLTNLTALYNDSLKNYEKAAYYAQKAFDVNPNDLGAHSNLAESLVSAGRYKEARNHANTVLKIDYNPNHKLAMYFAISSSYFLESNIKEGTKYLKNLEEYRSSLPSTFMNEWNYDGITNLLSKSNIPDNYKTKLFKAINTLAPP